MTDTNPSFFSQAIADGCVAPPNPTVPSSSREKFTMPGTSAFFSRAGTLARNCLGDGDFRAIRVSILPEGQEFLIALFGRHLVAHCLAPPERFHRWPWAVRECASGFPRTASMRPQADSSPSTCPQGFRGRGWPDTVVARAHRSSLRWRWPRSSFESRRLHLSPRAPRSLGFLCLNGDDQLDERVLAGFVRQPHQLVGRGSSARQHRRAWRRPRLRAASSSPRNHVRGRPAESSRSLAKSPVSIR